MSAHIGKAFYAVLFFAVFVGLLVFVSGGHWGPVLFAAPLLFFAETVYFVNQYLNIFQDGHEEEEAHEREARKLRPHWERLAH